MNRLLAHRIELLQISSYWTRECRRELREQPLRSAGAIRLAALRALVWAERTHALSASVGGSGMSSHELLRCILDRLASEVATAPRRGSRDPVRFALIVAGALLWVVAAVLLLAR